MFAVVRWLLCLSVATALLYAVFVQNPSTAIGPFTSTELNTLSKTANEFEGRKVKVRGVVEQGAAVFGRGTYRLRQGESEIWILTNRGVPDAGSEVTVIGTFRQAAKLGTMQVAVILQD
jgi:hypothetical protein